MKQYYPFLFLLSICVVFLSCNKEPTIIEGFADVSYESGNQLNILTNYKVTVSGGSSKLYVENANPYRDLIGNIIHNNPEANGASNLILKDLNSYEIYMECKDPAELNTYLSDARLVVFDESSAQKTVLADLINYEAGTGILNFNINNGDFADLFVDFTSEKIYFEFDFNSFPPNNIDVIYQVKMNAAYSFEEQ